LTAVLLLGVAVAVPAEPPRTLPAPAELQRTVDALTAPELAGRRSGTPEGDRAARDLAGWLAAAGLQPGGDGGRFLQSFVIGRARAVAPASALVHGAGAGRLALGTDWTPHGGSRAGAVAGELVFVGHGVGAGEWDDYAGLDVRGKIALALAGPPPHRSAAGASRLEKLILARERGAAALLIVAEPLPGTGATGSPVDLVSGAVAPAAADRLLAPSGRSVRGLAERIVETRAPAAQATGLRVELRVDFTEADTPAANVVGVLPGTDPRRASEAVVIGAHYDHLGVVGGAIHPGADDNASGTAVVLGLARAFAAGGRAPRTLVFAFFGAEEMGLLGSGHYVRQPAWPLDRTVAMLNFDMVGRMRDGGLHVGGVDSGQGLRRLVEEAARAEGVTAALHASPFSSSDHSRFYGAGTSALFFFTGRHADYHRPGDTADKIDGPGMARVAALGARIVDELAAGASPAYVKLDPPRVPESPIRPPAGVAFLGVVSDARGADGAALARVLPDSAAARAGLRDGDVLVRLGEATVNSFDELRAVLGTARPGERVVIVYLRDGVARTGIAALDAAP
jgi:acetylornithine deacetylase/succinyl-diaminopimelate desuccinylase-like protein